MPGEIITLNVVEMEIENTPDVWGKLEVFDGDRETDRLLATYMITNGTLPQGITSTSNDMLVKFSWSIDTDGPCEILQQCIKFTLLVDAGPGKLLTVAFGNYIYMYMILLCFKMFVYFVIAHQVLFPNST